MLLVVSCMLNNPYSGKFIVIEGIDGSGKSAQADFVARCLADIYGVREGNILKVHEPSRSRFGVDIKKILLHKKEAPETPLKFQELFVRDRKEHNQGVVIPHLKKGGFVVCDRYLLSTFAYGMAQGATFAELMKLNEDILGDQFIYPDIVFIIDTDPSVALMRLQKREGAGPLEYFEKKSNLMIEAAANYRLLAGKFPNTHLVSGDRPIAEVSEHILKIIAQEKKLICLKR